MKKLLILLTLTITTVLQAQAPQGFNYQATVRNNSGDLIVNTNVYFKFNVIQGSQTAVPIFTETHYVPTDDLGQVNLVMGQGTANTGIFSELDWSLGSYYLGIELDTGNGYVAMGTTQLLSVPYALYAENSGNSTPTTPNLEAVLAENNSANNQQIKDLQDPTEAQDAVTKAYIDAQIAEAVAGLQSQIDDLESGDGSGTVTDLNGNTYDYLTYGNQAWTVENAEMVTYRDGTPIPEVTDNAEWANLTTGAWCYYNNDPTKPRLYNWYAVMGIHEAASLSNPSLRKEFAPEGWHIPSIAEWTTLENHLIANGYNYDDTITGNKIAKAMASTTGWNYSNEDGAPGNDQSLNNSSGFNAYPEGSRWATDTYSTFESEGSETHFWSSSHDSASGFPNVIFNYSSSVGNYDYVLQGGLSVRFVRDSEDNSENIDNDNDGYTENQGDCDDTNVSVYPGATEVEDGIDNDCDGYVDEGFGGSSPTCGGSLYDSGGATGDYANDELTTVTVYPDTAGDLVTFTFLSFETEANYDKIWVYDGPDTNATVILDEYSGSTIPDPITSSHPTGALTFVFDSDFSGTDSGYEILISCASRPFVTDQNGNTYDYLYYGDQVWTVENAEMVTYRDGTPIPQVTDNTEWENLTTGAWCYYNNDSTKPRLYNWYAVMGIHDTDPNTPNKEFAPEGWHVPSDAEWTTLENYLIANGYNYDGTTTENKIAKAMASTTGWISYDTTGAPGNDQSLNNDSGFNAFPEGLRSITGSFYNEGNDAIFWSSTEFNTNYVLYRNLNVSSSFLSRYNGYYEQGGFSVRFVRD